jgi:hypothetical protein
MAGLVLALVLIINLAVRGWLGAILEVAALFLSLALAVNVAVYGWLGALGAFSAKETNRIERLAYVFIAGIFTVMAAATWYALSFVVRPFG